jgi:uncharacterized membrane protein HdeD (DUF308 family)
METLIAILFIASGIFNLLLPQKAWLFELGWMYKKREMSDATLKTRRVMGAVMIAIGIYMIVM